MRSPLRVIDHRRNNGGCQHCLVYYVVVVYTDCVCLRRAPAPASNQTKSKRVCILQEFYSYFILLYSLDPTTPTTICLIKTSGPRCSLFRFSDKITKCGVLCFFLVHRFTINCLCVTEESTDYNINNKNSK